MAPPRILKLDMALCYDLYGFPVKTAFPFPYGERVSRPHQIEITEQTDTFFSKATAKLAPPQKYPNVFYHQFSDFSEYVRLFNSFHFWISPAGKEIAYQTLPLKEKKARPEEIRSSFVSCLQSSVLSFAMMKWGVEPIHSSAVVVDNEAVAFLGDSGLGKSTLTAAFVKMGFPLLTDDILAVRKRGGSFMAAAGAPCVKLFPETARQIFKGKQAAGPMYPRYPKLIFPLRGNRIAKGMPRLKAFCLLREPKNGSKEIRIRRLTKRQASIELVRSTYNCLNQSAARLKGQLLFAAELTEKIPLISLTYPRDYRYLPRVCETILAHMRK